MVELLEPEAKTPILGKTVYVLGAGASAHTGAPLLRDFLVRARLLLEGKTQLTRRDSFKRVFKWLDELRSSAYYVDVDLDNLEHVFSLADMKRQLGHDDGERLYSDLTHIVMETLDHCQLDFRRQHYKADRLYSSFAGKLRDLNEERRQRVRQSASSFEKDAIITFNYDVMLEFAMRQATRKIRYEYRHGRRKNPDLYPVLKLHGSTNWAICSSCNKKRIQVVPAGPLLKGEKARRTLKDGDRPSFKMVTHVLRNTKCKVCAKKGVLQPLVIPPTWSKAISNPELAAVWAAAVEEIRSAFQIIIVGYSMPATDTFFQYLAALGLTGNPNLHRVVVVNKDNSDDLKDRYRRVFSRSMYDRGRLLFLSKRFGPSEGVTFQHFVAEGQMHIYGGGI